MNATIKAMIEGLKYPEANPGIDQLIREAIVLGDSRTLEKCKEKCFMYQTLATRAYGVVSGAMKRVSDSMESEVKLFTEQDLRDLNEALAKTGNACEWYRHRVSLITSYL